jgi:hypothetical protein
VVPPSHNLVGHPHRGHRFSSRLVSEGRVLHVHSNARLLSIGSGRGDLGHWWKHLDGNRDDCAAARTESLERIDGEQDRGLAPLTVDRDTLTRVDGIAVPAAATQRPQWVAQNLVAAAADELTVDDHRLAMLLLASFRRRKRM